MVLDLVGFGVILPILPLYAQDLGATPLVIGVVLSAYSVAQLLGAPLLGRWSDRVGRKPVLVLALVGSAVGHIVTGLSGTVWLIILARFLDGLSGGSLSVAQAAVSDLAPPEERPRLFGLLGAGIAVGFVAGPALGSLAALGGTKLPFFVAAALCGANALTAWWRVPETRPEPSGAPDAAPHRPAWSALWTTLASRTRLGSIVLTSLLTGLGFAGFEATFSLLARRRVGLEEGGAGLVFAAVGIVLAVVQGLLVRRVIGRVGELATAQLGIAVLVGGFAVGFDDLGWLGLAPALALLTVGQGLLSPSLSAAVASAAPPHQRGATFGIQQAASALSRVVGPLAATALYQVGVGLPYAVGGGLCLAALAVVQAARARPDPVPGKQPAYFS